MRPLDNQTFSVGIINATFSLVHKFDDGTVVGHSGPDFNILQTLSELLGFSYRLLIPNDLQYGVLKDGKWNGLIGMVRRNEADFGATTMAWSHDRETAIEFSDVCHQDKFVYITRQLINYNVKSSYFFAKPFQRKVWLLVGLFMMCSVFLLPSIRLFLPKYKHVLKPFTFWNILSLMMGIANPRSMVKSNYHGLAVGTLLVVLGVVLKIYGSTLASSVNSNPIERPIDTIADLVDAVQNKNLSVGLLKQHSVIQIILKNSKRAELQVLSKHLKKRGKDGELTFPNAIEAMWRTNFALIIGLDTFVQLMNDYEYSMRKVHVPKETLLKNNKAMVLSKHFPHKSLFNRVIRRIFAYGFMYKWGALQRYKLEMDLAKARSSSSVKYIDMNDLEYIIISLMVAYMSALAVVLLEKLFYVYKYLPLSSDKYD